MCRTSSAIHFLASHHVFYVSDERHCIPRSGYIEKCVHHANNEPVWQERFATVTDSHLCFAGVGEELQDIMVEKVPLREISYIKQVRVEWR